MRTKTPTRAALATLAGLGLAAPALSPAMAEGYSVANLGQVVSRAECMLQAELAMQRYMQADGGLSVQASDWSVYGWDFRPGDQDVVILCPALEDGRAQAVLVVHGETSKRDREHTKDQLLKFFKR